MTIQELNHIEKELKKIQNFPLDLATSYAIQIIKDIKANNKEVLKAFLYLENDTLVIDYKQ